MSEHTPSRRDVLKATTGMGIAASGTGIFGGLVSASHNDPTLPNDIWPYYDFGCDSDSECPGTVESDEFIIRDDNSFTSVGSYAFNWYGSAWNDTFGWTHGIGIGGGCESESHKCCDGFPSELRGQRYSLHVPYPVEGEDLLVSTSNHLFSDYPAEDPEDTDWAETLLLAAIEHSMSYLPYGMPINTLLEAMGTYDGFDRDAYDVGYRFTHTGRVIPREFWDRCAHTDAVIYITNDLYYPYLKVKQDFRMYSGFLSHWEGVEYTITSFDNVDPLAGSSTTSDTNLQTQTTGEPDQLTPEDRRRRGINSGPSSVDPTQMSAEERKKWGVKSVEDMEIKARVKGENVKMSHILTKNPFSVVNVRRTSEIVDEKP